MHSIVEFGNDESAARAYLATLPEVDGVSTAQVTGSVATPAAPRAVQTVPPTPCVSSRVVSITDGGTTTASRPSTQMQARTGSAGAAARAAGAGQPRGPTPLPPLPPGLVVTGPFAGSVLEPVGPTPPVQTAAPTQPAQPAIAAVQVQRDGAAVRSPVRPRPPPTPLPSGVLVGQAAPPVAGRSSVVMGQAPEAPPRAADMAVGADQSARPPYSPFAHGGRPRPAGAAPERPPVREPRVRREWAYGETSIQWLHCFLLVGMVSLVALKFGASLDTAGICGTSVAIAHLCAADYGMYDRMYDAVTVEGARQLVVDMGQAAWRWIRENPRPTLILVLLLFLVLKVVGFEQGGTAIQHDMVPIRLHAPCCGSSHEFPSLALVAPGKQLKPPRVC